MNMEKDEGEKVYKHRYTKLFQETDENGILLEPEQGMVIGYDKDILILSFYLTSSTKKNPHKKIEASVKSNDKSVLDPSVNAEGE